MKSTYMKLREKAKTYLAPRHPFHSRDVEFRERYAAAVLLQTQLSDQVTSQDNFELARLLTFGLELNRGQVIETIRYAGNREKVLDYCLDRISEKQEKIIFLLDLWNVSYTGSDFGDKEREAILIYSELFHVSQLELSELRKFIKDALKDDADACIQDYEHMQSLGMPVNMGILRYYIPGLEYTTVVDPSAFTSGKNVILTGLCEIRDPVVIPRGCTLTFHNARVMFYCPVAVAGGNVKVLDSDLEYRHGSFSSFFNIDSGGKCLFSGATFICHNACGGIHQKGGSLTVSDCRFYDTNTGSAIYFSGEEINVSDCQFRDCFNTDRGAAICIDQGRGTISSSNFLRCMSDRGGAVAAVEPVVLTGLVFSGCHASVMGFSIYYEGVGQNFIKRCIYENSTDDRLETVQVVRDHDIERLGDEITLSVWFPGNVHLNGSSRIHMENINLYLSHCMRVVCGLDLYHVNMIPWEFAGDDMVDCQNGGSIAASDCTFDGAGKFGIFKATGTRIEMKSCEIANTAGGRAVYNSVNLTCDDCIFTNCLGGGIYGSRAIVRNCIFVNCRGDRGAGIALTGSKGIIKQCTFDRCIASIADGAVNTFGNYQVTDCSFRECEPHH